MYVQESSSLEGLCTWNCVSLCLWFTPCCLFVDICWLLVWTMEGFPCTHGSLQLISLADFNLWQSWIKGNECNLKHLGFYYDQNWIFIHYRSFFQNFISHPTRSSCIQWDEICSVILESNLTILEVNRQKTANKFWFEKIKLNSLSLVWLMSATYTHKKDEGFITVNIWFV